MQLTSNGRPLLFLFDEILQGTKSNDRYAGAEAIIRTLLRRGAIGLVTTHDLKLTRIVDNLQPLAKNVHFSDQIIKGELHFDHKMHPGIVQTTNALTLMRNMGLDI